MNHRKMRWMMALLVALVALGAAPSAFAQDVEDDDDRETAFEDGPIVRRKLLYRSTRFEVAPQLGVTINDAFRRNMLVGANFAYHLTNSFGIAASAGYGILQFDTNLSESIETELAAENEELLADISYSYIEWMADLGLSYVPIFGKFSLLKSATVNYDINLTAGVSVVNEAVDPAIEGGSIDESIGGIRPGGFVGVGMRLFLSDGLSLNFQLKDLIYNRAEISSRNLGEAEIANTFVGFVGVSLFLPGEVKISR